MQRPRSTLPILVTSGVVIVIVIGFAFFSNLRNHITSLQTGAQTGTTAYVSSSYATTYTSIAALKHDADAIIVGTVIGPQSVGYEQNTSAVVSVFAVQVDTVVKGSVSASGVVYVYQNGGDYNGVHVINLDEPPFTSGDRVILFLSLSSSPDHYYVVGGPQGRFQVVGGFVQTVGISQLKLPSQTTEASIVAQLRS